MIDILSLGLAFLAIGAIAIGYVLWDDLVDLMSGLKRRGHRPVHDVERTVPLHTQRARASARARVPLQRRARHRRK